MGNQRSGQAASVAHTNFCDAHGTSVCIWSEKQLPATSYRLPHGREEDRDHAGEQVDGEDNVGGILDAPQHVELLRLAHLTRAHQGAGTDELAGEAGRVVACAGRVPAYIQPNDGS